MWAVLKAKNNSLQFLLQNLEKNLDINSNLITLSLFLKKIKKNLFQT